MIPKEKAVELIEKFKKYVHGYVGSGVLTNHEYPDQVLKQAKKVAVLCAREVLASSPSLPILSEAGSFVNDIEESTEYWIEVLTEIENY